MQSLLALLQFYNTYDHDDIYFSVAGNFLFHTQSVANWSLVEAAEQFHCSTSTITRFCRLMCYPSYPVMREDLSRLRNHYFVDMLSTQSMLAEAERETTSDCGGKHLLGQVADQAVDSMRREQLAGLVRKFYESDKIGFYGYSLPQAIWLLQIDFIMGGKRTTAFLDPNYQLEDVQALDHTCTAVFCHYTKEESYPIEEMISHAVVRGAYTVVITNTPSLFRDISVDNLLVFSHYELALSMMTINTIITMLSLEYQKYAARGSEM